MYMYNYVDYRYNVTVILFFCNYLVSVSSTLRTKVYQKNSVRMHYTVLFARLKSIHCCQFFIFGFRSELPTALPFIVSMLI